MPDQNCNEVDRAASLVSSKLHIGDGGQQARDLLYFEATTMGKADYKQMVQQVRTNEALDVNEMLMTGDHNGATERLRDDARVFGNGEDFVELASQIRSMNQRSESFGHRPSLSHLDFNPVYQSGDEPGRPTAEQFSVNTNFRSAQTGEIFPTRGVVTTVDNRSQQDSNCGPQPLRNVVIMEPPPPHVDTRIGVGVGGGRTGVGVGIGIDNGGGFSFDLEIEIGKQRRALNDDHWCPPDNWRPRNAPADFNLQIAIDRTRELHRQRGDHDWEPRRNTPPQIRQVINNTYNTTIINNDSHDVTNSNNRTRTDNTSNSNNRTKTENTDNSRTKTEDNSRTRTTDDSNNRTRPQEAPPSRGDNKPPQRGENQPRKPESDRTPPAAQPDRPAPQERSQPQRREPQRDSGNDDRQREAQDRRQKAQEAADKARAEHDKDKANRKR